MVKKIVSGQTYDTDTATRLHYRTGHGGDVYQGLYQTPEGEFFFWEYDEELGDVKPTTNEEAHEWLEKHANHLLGQYFLEGRAAKRRLIIQLPASLVLRLEALAAKKSLSLKSYVMRSLKQCASAEERASAEAPMVVRSRPKWLCLHLDPFDGFDGEATYVPEIVREIMDEVYRALHNKSRRLVAMGARATLEHVFIDKVGDVGNFTDKIDKMEKDDYLSGRQRMNLDTILDAGNATIHRGWEPTDEQISTVLDITERLIESTYIHNERAARLARAVPQRPPRAKKS